MRKLGMFCALALLFMSGCATDPASTPWRDLKEADFRALKPGATQKDEVAKLLGAPFQRARFESRGEEVWDYRYQDGSMQMLAWVFFDLRGKYTHFVGQPDPARYSGSTH